MTNIRVQHFIAFLFLCFAVCIVGCTGCGGMKSSDAHYSSNLEIDTTLITNSDVLISEEDTLFLWKREEINQRAINWQSENDKYAVRFTKKIYGEEFAENHRIHLWPINDPDRIADKSELVWLSEAVDKYSRLPKKLYRFDMFDSLHWQLNIDEHNPYYKYIDAPYEKNRFVDAYGYYNSELNVHKTPQVIKEFLSNQERSYPVNIDTRLQRQGEEYIMLNYMFGLHPRGEIIEFKPFPGITTLELFDKDGNSIAKLRDLPFVVDQWHVTMNARYALLEHQPPIDEPFNPKRFEHYISLYDLTTGSLCFRESNTKFRYSTGEPNANNFYHLRVGKEHFVNQDSTYWMRYHILNSGEILSYTILNSGKIDGYEMIDINTEGIFYKSKEDGSLLNANTRFDFKILKTECNE